MVKALYELLKLNFSVTGNPIADLLITAIIFSFFNEIAYSWVGDFYKVGIIDGRSSGSMLNFTLKIIFLLLAMGIMKTINILQGLFS